MASEMQLVIEADKARLKELKAQGVGIKKANAAIGKCHIVLESMIGSTFTSMEEQAKVVNEPGQPIDQSNLRVLRSSVGQTVMAQRYLDVQVSHCGMTVRTPSIDVVTPRWMNFWMQLNIRKAV
jgi:hypothetical protein